MLTNQEAQPLLSSTFATALWRACDHAGIKGLHFQHLEAQALTNSDERHDIKEAQKTEATR